MAIKQQSTLDTLREQGRQRLYPDVPRITVGMATCGQAAGAAEVYQALQEATQGTSIAVVPVGCRGYCQREPLVDVRIPGWPRLIYAQVTPDQARELAEAASNRQLVLDGALGREDNDKPLWGEEQILATDSVPEQIDTIPLLRDIDFYKHQVRIATRNCGIIDPASLPEYVARGGYQALAKVLEQMTPEEVIEEITASGLRGRGGGGFPTGRKWRSCREAKGEPHYVICNADEGDPGAYMDRSILEGDPHAVLEGMIIGAYAIGSPQGYIYVRAEYPLAVSTLREAINQARTAGLLGNDILGSGFAFDIDIVRGGGAFVCGESTALMASVEGRAGEPRSKYVHTVESGLWDKPTNLNNVETWANVPAIIAQGPDWFSSIGTEKSKGTKVFSAVGNVQNTGLVEVPMGMTLHELVYDVCGGVLDGRELKAIQTGGPSGGCIPAELLDLPIDYEHLTEAGSMMGSGGMIVMDDRTCMVELARYFTEFLVEESCGKCGPCREGLYQMLHILTDITQGRGKPEYIEQLEELGELLSWASLCALGGTAANPVLSTLRYFREEYEAHIYDKKCPAGVCQELISYRIDPEACTGCHLCARNCPQQAIVGDPKEPHQILTEKCIKCGICREVCKFDAVVVE